MCMGGVAGPEQTLWRTAEMEWDDQPSRRRSTETPYSPAVKNLTFMMIKAPSEWAFWKQCDLTPITLKPLTISGKQKCAILWICPGKHFFVSNIMSDIERKDYINCFTPPQRLWVFIARKNGGICVNRGPYWNRWQFAKFHTIPSVGSNFRKATYSKAVYFQGWNRCCTSWLEQRLDYSNTANTKNMPLYYISFGTTILHRCEFTVIASNTKMLINKTLSTTTLLSRGCWKVSHWSRNL